MAVVHDSPVARVPPAAPPPGPAEVGLRRRLPKGRAAVLPAAALAVGVGLAVIVARDGTPGWQLVRLLVVVAVVGAAWRLLAPPRSLRRSLTAVALAAVALPVGIGIGGPYLVKTGISVPTAAGLLVLFGGLLLFGGGLAGLFRSSSRRLRVPACAAGVVVVLLLCWTLGQALAATNVPRTEVGPRTPAALGLDYRDVAFAATDGVRLSGWYVPSRNRAAVVLLHGSGSTRSEVLNHAAVLARHGFGVLLFDARGHGRSAGRAMDFGWLGDRDVGGAVAFLRAQGDVDAARIAAVGLSMGGEDAIGASAALDSISAVVAEGATNRVAGDKAWLSDEFGVRGAVSEGVEALTYGMADLLTSAGPPVTLHDAVHASARPTLLIAAGDVADEARAGRYIQSASPKTVELWVVPGTGHTHALYTHPGEWEARVVAFLDTALGVDGSGAGLVPAPAGG
jgi:pimeloyl-ACP methyl ester carboxylesterase